jgi:hypothetical protein
MRRLFQFGHEQAVNNTAWITRKSAANMDELREMPDIYEMLEPTIPGANMEE